MSNQPYDQGNHLVMCDICGTQRYRSECQYTWDGFLACTKYNCWYPKDPLFMIPPVINDPHTLYDVRPEIPFGTEKMVIPNGGDGLSTWDHIVNAQAVSGSMIWGNMTMTWDGFDVQPDYVSGTYNNPVGSEDY